MLGRDGAFEELRETRFCRRGTRKPIWARGTQGGQEGEDSVRSGGVQEGRGQEGLSPEMEAGQEAGGAWASACRGGLSGP